MKTKDDKPCIPPDTCPYIDSVINDLDNILDIEDRDLQEKLCDSMNATLEYIRLSNNMLRNASWYWRGKYEKEIAKNKRLKNKIEKTKKTS